MELLTQLDGIKCSISSASSISLLSESGDGERVGEVGGYFEDTLVQYSEYNTTAVPMKPLFEPASTLNPTCQPVLVTAVIIYSGKTGR